MQQERLERIEKATFRANSIFELAPFDRLPAGQQHFLNKLKGVDCYGILRPRRNSLLEIKSVDRDTALLFLALQAPSRMPAYVKSQLGALYYKFVLGLVFDKVLEIEWNGAFLSGVEACVSLSAAHQVLVMQSEIARLSLEAIKCAQALELGDSAKISTRLYCYNRVPLSPYWQRKFPTSDDVAEHLGLWVHGSTTLLLRGHWTMLRPDSAFEKWFTWIADRTQTAPRISPFVYKLYISPACEGIRDAFQTAVEVLANSPAIGFKIGKDVSGLLRPDKFVAYFPSMEACQDTAVSLEQKLTGIPAHGVPFTAEIAGNGLLSWGVDPPGSEQRFAGQRMESWRMWVTNRLASALLVAKADLCDAIEPWQFALERLKLDGVDTESWTPPELDWQMDL